MLEKSVGEDVGEECWRREVLQRGVVDKCWRRVLEKMLEKSVGEERSCNEVL